MLPLPAVVATSDWAAVTAVTVASALTRWMVTATSSTMSASVSVR